MSQTLTAASPQATIYTTLGQTLRVPLSGGGPPENQLISWLNRQAAANPAFPVRIRSILLLPGPAGSAAGAQALRRFLSQWQLAGRLRVVRAGGGQAAELSGELETATTIIHPNIDVAAQRALLRMLTSQDSFLRDAATRILADVRSGQLRGVYQEDQQAPALRARKLGRNWWQLIPPDVDAVKLKAPPESPMLVFRKTIRNDHARLEEALLTSYWHPLAMPPRGIYGRPL